MATGEQKRIFMNAFAGKITTLINSVDDLVIMKNMYHANGYAVSGADEITQADLDTTGYLQAELTAGITFVENIYKALNNDETFAQGDYMANINKLRTNP